MSVWNKTDTETNRAFAAFQAYLRLGPNRSLSKAVQVLGEPPGYVNSLKAWCTKHHWVERAGAYDRRELAADLESMEASRERARQLLADNAEEAAQTIVELLSAKDADGNPSVKPSTRLQAAINALEFAGVIKPKRVELAKPDNLEKQRAVAKELRQLTDEQFYALFEAAKAAGIADDEPQVN